jgi:hypothetical protein
MEDIEVPEDGVLTAFRAVDDCTVQLRGGAEIRAALDTEVLRATHGRVYGIQIGGPVRVLPCDVDGKWRIIWIEQID